MRNKLPKFFVVTGTFFCCVSILVSITGMDAWAQPTPQGGQGKKCEVTREEEWEPHECKNGSCPSSVKHYAKAGKCVAVRDCYELCGLHDKEPAYQEYKVKRKFQYLSYTYSWLPGVPGIAIRAICSGGRIVLVMQGVVPAGWPSAIITTIACNIIGNAADGIFYPPYDTCNHLKCEREASPSNASSNMVTRCF